MPVMFIVGLALGFLLRENPHYSLAASLTLGLFSDSELALALQTGVVLGFLLNRKA
jgi:hypothetical protein